MADSARGPFVRADAVVVNVYNDGLCVYLFDKTAEAELASLIASGQYAGTNPCENLHQNLQSADFAREVAARGLAVVYELNQDDSLNIEIGVGAALTQKELGKGHWLKAQSGYLNLPSGQLCVESPNTLRMGQSNPTDKGGTVNVPPGAYKVTIHRTDWDALHREGIEDYHGPNEFILLSPLKKAPAKTAKTPILPYVAPIDPNAWRGAFNVEGKNFTAMVKSGYWWTPILCNLDRDAVNRLGIERGALLEVKVFNLTIVALYLGDEEYKGAFKTFGEDGFKELKQKYPEFAVAHWGTWTTYGGDGGNRTEEKEVFLILDRPDGEKPYPAKGHELWVEATGRVLDKTHSWPVLGN